jgi:hypothetical protein
MLLSEMSWDQTTVARVWLIDLFSTGLTAAKAFFFQRPENHFLENYEFAFRAWLPRTSNICQAPLYMVTFGSNSSLSLPLRLSLLLSLSHSLYLHFTLKVL